MFAELIAATHLGSLTAFALVIFVLVSLGLCLWLLRPGAGQTYSQISESLFNSDDRRNS